MRTTIVQKAEHFLSTRRLGVAGIAAFIACAACCAVPLLAAAGLGTGSLTSLAFVFRPGSEFTVGAAVFLVALGVMAVRARMRTRAVSGCGSTCRVDGTCCDRGAAPNRS